MKNLIIVLTAAVLLFTNSFCTIAAVVTGSVDVPVYKRELNPKIGVTPESNSLGRNYKVYNDKGDVVQSGIIKDTLYILTNKLPDGLYRFAVGSYILQSFVIR